MVSGVFEGAPNPNVEGYVAGVGKIHGQVCPVEPAALALVSLPFQWALWTWAPQAMAYISVKQAMSSSEVRTNISRKISAKRRA